MDNLTRAELQFLKNYNEKQLANNFSDLNSIKRKLGHHLDAGRQRTDTVVRHFDTLKNNKIKTITKLSKIQKKIKKALT